MLDHTFRYVRDCVTLALRRVDIRSVVIHSGHLVLREDPIGSRISTGRGGDGSLTGRAYVEACEAWAAPSRRRTA